MRYSVLFSPTGGCRKVAGLLNPSGRVLDLECLEAVKFEKEDEVFIVFPSFGGRLPGFVADRFSSLVKGDGTPAVLVVVYGNRAYEDTLVEMEDLARANGFNPIGGVAALAQHSIFPAVAEGRPDSDDERTLGEFASRIEQKLKEGEGDLKLPGNRPYKPRSKGGPKIEVDASRCVGCGLCQPHCPTGAVGENGRATDAALCISCMRCIATCPNGARSVAGFDKMWERLASKFAGRKEPELFL